MIPKFTIDALMGHPLTLYKNSQFRREWTHVLDHCAALDSIIHHGRIGETYNVGSGEEADIELIADTVLSTLGLSASLKTYIPDRPGHDRRYLLDCTKLRSELGWQPTVPLPKGIRQTILWYRDNPEWWRNLLDLRSVDEVAWQGGVDENRT